VSNGTVTVEVGHFIFTTSERKKRGEKSKDIKKGKVKREAVMHATYKGHTH
jgi:hypothetical protein